MATYTGTTGNDTLAGTSAGDVLNGNAGSDSLAGGAGNDTINAGDGIDRVSGGGDGDSISGGAGDDILFGDNATTPTTGQETLSWIAQGASGTSITNGFTQDTGGMRVTVGVVNDGRSTGVITTNATQYRASGETHATNSAAAINGSGQGATSTTTITFDADAGSGLDDEVSDVRFRINDVDRAGWWDVITIRAYDANGNLVTATLTAAGNDSVSGQTVTAGNTNDTAAAANGSVLVTIPGPVHSVQIVFSNRSTGGQVITVTDVQFTTRVPTDGNDIIDGGEGNDTIHGQGGSDTLYGGTGSDLLNGGDGDDRAEGGAGHDTLNGDGGNDSLSGGNGNDSLSGGSGNDVLDLGAGNDTALGGDGDDTITDLNGDDSAWGGAGNDTILAGDGEDFLSGDDGNDFLNGGAGNDSLRGGLGDDSMQGGTGNDRLTGDDGDDRIDGGDGNDVLDGGTGSDTLQGGAGDDLFVIGNGSGSDSVIGGETGEAAGDVLDASAVTQDITLDLSSGSGGAEDGTLGFAGASITFGEIESVVLGSGNDSVTGSTAADSVTAGAGNDRLDMGAGDDRVALGNDGFTDTLVFDDGDGHDRVTGFEAPVQNPDGSWTGRDQIDVSDLLDGQGNPVDTADVVVTDDGNGNAVLTFPGGESLTLVGVSPAQLSSPMALIAMGIPSGLDHVVEGSAGDDFITPGYTGDPDGDRVDGNDSPGAGNDDLIEAYGGHDLVLAGTGNDTVYGGTGNDTLLGQTGDDRLHGESGDDVMDGGDGNDTLIGGEGQDSLTGGEGRDSLAGGTGHDWIDAGDGNDVIDAGDGNDSVLAGAGDDSIVGGADDDHLAGEDGNDSLSGGSGTDTLSGGAGNDWLDAGEGNDFIEGGLGNDTVLGGDGDDSINGAEGDDYVSGGDGNDYIRGSYGNDTVTGGHGDDYVWGGYGDDRIVVEDDFGNDTIYGDGIDETSGDTLDLSAVTGALRFDLRHADAERGSFTDGTYTATFDEIEHLVLGAGVDTLVLADYSGTDRVAGFAGPTQNPDGSWTGHDLLDVSDLTFNWGERPVNTGDVVVTDDGNGNAVLTFPGGESLTLIGVAPATLQSPWALHAIGIPLGLDHTVEGTAGDDVIDASYLGDPDGDRVDAGDAANGSNDDLIHAGDGNDTVLAGVGNDTVLGGAGNDDIQGGAGHDTLRGGTGDDHLSGDAGDDRFVLEPDFGNDSVIGGETGESLGDSLDAGGLTTGVTLDLSAGDPDDGEDGTLTDGTDTITFSEIEGVMLGAGEDTVIGSTGGDTVATGAGDDIVFGGGGADLFNTGDGNDEVHFGENATVSGGDGNDLFVFEDAGEAGTGHALILGGDGDDTLDLGQGADLSTLTITASGPDGAKTGHVTLDDGSILSFTGVENIICFTPGARIATIRGARAVQTLAVGDLVVTRDHGLQPIRWIGRRTVPAIGHFAPVRIRPGVVTGLERDLLVSPQHRMLFRGYRAELLFGESEVLMAATHLVDGHSVTVEEGGLVTYIHLMFDQHEIIYAEGAATESFHAGDVGLGALTDAGRDEVFALFPDLRSLRGAAGQTARRCLKRHETLLLLE